MVIQCPECKKKYKIDSERIPEEKGAKISCPGCGHTFVVKRKEKEQAEPKSDKLKTPPCVMCGNPSTRVLKGDPPLVLCETCFEREKEKRRRFEIAPSFEDFSGDKDEESLGGQPGQEQHTAPAAGSQGNEDFFDSFSEIPDMGDVPVQTGPAPKPAAPKPEKAEKAPAPKSTPMPTKTEEPMFDESSFEEDSKAPETPRFSEPPPPPPTPPPTTPPARRKAAVEKPAPASRQAEGDEVDSDFIFSPSEVSQLEENAAGASKSKPQPAAGASHTPSAKPVPQSPPPVYQEGNSPSAEKTPAQDLDKELFGDIAARMTPAEAKPAAPPKRIRRKMKIPYKAVAGIAAAIVVLIGGYFLIPSILKSRGGEQNLALGDEDAKLVAGHLSMAQDLYRLDTKKNYMEAMNEANAALKIDPGSKKAKAMQMLVSAFLADQDHNWFVRTRAKALAKKADAGTLAEPEAQVARVLVFLNDNDASGAKMTAEKLAADNPENALANWALAHVYLSSPVKDQENAEPILNKAIALDPKLVQARIELGELFFSKKDWQPATEQFQEALKLSPSLTGAAQKLKDIELAQKQTPQPTPIGTNIKPGTPGGLLLGQGNTTQRPININVKPQTGSTTIVATAPTIQLGPEIQQHLLGIIAETRRPMSRMRTAAPAQPQPTPGTTTRPPEEAPPANLWIPPKPPEEAP